MTTERVVSNGTGQQEKSKMLSRVPEEVTQFEQKGGDCLEFAITLANYLKSDLQAGRPLGLRRTSHCAAGAGAAGPRVRGTPEGSVEVDAPPCISCVTSALCPDGRTKEPTSYFQNAAVGDPGRRYGVEVGDSDYKQVWLLQ